MSINKNLLLNLFHVIVDGLFGSTPILLSFMIVSFGAKEKEAGIIISLVNMIITVAGLSTIFFSRRLGFLRTISMITLLLGIGFITNAFSHNIYFAGLCFILANAGFGVFHNVAFSYLAATTDRTARGKAIGNFSAIGDIGRIPLASFAGFIATMSIFGFPGWRIICFSYGFCTLLCAGYVYILSFQENLPLGEMKKPLPSFGILRNRQYALPTSAGILDAFGSNQVFVFLPFLFFTKGIDPQIIGSFAFSFTLGSLLGKAVFGRMVDIFGTRKVLGVSEVIMAILLFLIVISQQTGIIVGVSFLLGIVTKGTFPVIQTIITESANTKHEYDDIFAINSFVCGITNMLSPLLFGFIASSIGVKWSFMLMAIAAVSAVIPILIMGNISRITSPSI